MMWSHFLLLAPPCAASFMAMGPPGAPPLHHIDSVKELSPELMRVAMSPFPNLQMERRSVANVSGGADVSQAAAGDYWYLTDPKFKHKMPYANIPNYEVIRNVRDFGAKGDGHTDDHFAIMSAVTAGARCGQGCNSTSTRGAIVYFPPGTYAISAPLVQYYFTQFVGHPTKRPILKALPSFKGMAMVDTDVYGDYGVNWWTNTNNFYRHVRNFVFDMTSLPATVEGGPEGNSPTGIHWQVAQQCTLQNIHFQMPNGGRHIGVFMENGSGGFVSDLSFEGGRIGFYAGNQQYTARNLRFKNVQTAIWMEWAWGFTWKNVQISDCPVGIDASKSSGPQQETGRMIGTGALTVLDSKFVNVAEAIKIAPEGQFRPNLVVDNVRIQGNTGQIISQGNGNSLIPRSRGANQVIKSWAMGRRYTTASTGGRLEVGDLPANGKGTGLLTRDGAFFERPKPQYANEPASAFLNVLDFGVSNDGTGADGNVHSIDIVLRLASRSGKILVFPAGVYAVSNTIYIPKHVRMVGTLWSQIMAVGPRFSNANKPHVLVVVGAVGDRGSVEISDFIFTTQGNTAGAILMQWNIHEDKQGSAGIWDSVFRVGGAEGTNLRDTQCHWKNADTSKCQAAQMMLHVTPKSSIYMENMWFWVADHDIETANDDRINVYGARGVLIESQGPSWVHSASNEHSTLYNWQLSEASNVYLGHIQSETPYFQAGQSTSLQPFPPQKHFPHDPSFSDCPATAPGAVDTCKEAWALRIIKSSNVFLYGGGFYSFFQNYKDDCAKTHGCQDRLVDMDRSENVFLYNLWTVGAKEAISPQGKLPAARLQDNLNGFATAISAYLMLGSGTANIGGTRRDEP